MSDREQVECYDFGSQGSAWEFWSIGNPQMENRQATVVDHKLESRPQEGGKRKVISDKYFDNMLMLDLIANSRCQKTECRFYTL